MTSKKPLCRVVTPPSADACGKPAKFKITFKDGDFVTACPGCALSLEQIAAEHKTQILVEALDG